MNSEDLRVQRTRKLLKEALVEMILNEGYEHVTIRGITNKAQVGYKTFFRHYESIEALTESLCTELLADFRAEILNPREQGAPQQNTLMALVFAEAHRDLFLALYKTPSAHRLVNIYLEFAIKEGELTFPRSVIPDRLVAYHFATSMIDLFVWWLQEEMPFTHAEMANYIDKLLLQPLSQLEMRVDE